VVLVLAPAAASQVAADPSVAALAKALREPGLSRARTAAVVIDLSDRRRIYAQNPDKPLAPASNEKLAVALAALHELGAGFRIETVVLGRGARQGAVWKGDVILKGYGDPSLHTDDLRALAASLEELGIEEIDGRVLGDETYFDDRRTAPGWKPSFYKLECPPLSALVVDRAVLDGRTRDEPALAAARSFTRTLERAGIEVAGKAGKGSAGNATLVLARVYSPPIRKLVDHMNSDSDNFVAEMLLKQLGARELADGSTAAGARIVRRVLATRGVPLAGVVIMDGSGLSRLDRLTASALAALLMSGWNDPAISRAFRASLAVAGVNGTLEDRMTDGPAHRVVRAKTGTTNEASALAGYVGSGYVFAILMNGDPIPYWAARTAQDRFAQLLARSL
jgi:D-alanyl-D-alanine carboxypeptidase/D-alanyl-D-alanine-endopeptidase (penicillin-binding protein 4)